MRDEEMYLMEQIRNKQDNEERTKKVLISRIMLISNVHIVIVIVGI